jgi:hypothetical protein
MCAYIRMHITHICEMCAYVGMRIHIHTHTWMLFWRNLRCWLCVPTRIQMYIRTYIHHTLMRYYLYKHGNSVFTSGLLSMCACMCVCVCHFGFAVISHNWKKKTDTAQTIAFSMAFKCPIYVIHMKRNLTPSKIHTFSRYLSEWEVLRFAQWLTSVKLPVTALSSSMLTYRTHSFWKDSTWVKLKKKLLQRKVTNVNNHGNRSAFWVYGCMSESMYVCRRAFVKLATRLCPAYM